MESILKGLPDSELKVMMIVWESGKELATGEILAELKDTITWKLSTLQIILSRLVEKGFLSTRKVGRFNYYKAIVDKTEYTNFETRNFIQKIYNNSAKKLIASLLESDDSLTNADIEEIRNMLNKGGV